MLFRQAWMHMGGAKWPPPEIPPFPSRYKLEKLYEEYITQFEILPKFLGENIEAIKRYQVIKIVKNLYLSLS